MNYKTRPQDQTTDPDFGVAFDKFKTRIRADKQFDTYETAFSVWLMHWVNMAALLGILGYVLGANGDVAGFTWVVLATFSAGQVGWIWLGFRQVSKMFKVLTGRSIGDTVD